MEKKEEEQIIFSIRLPKEMYDYLKEEAVDERRSMNQQVIVHLINSIGKEAIQKSPEEIKREIKREDGREAGAEESEEGAASSILG